MAASEGEIWVQLATRIPKHLHRELKLYCVKSDVSIMDFVVNALEECAGAFGHRAEGAVDAARDAWNRA